MYSQVLVLEHSKYLYLFSVFSSVFLSTCIFSSICTCTWVLENSCIFVFVFCNLKCILKYLYNYSYIFEYLYFLLIILAKYFKMDYKLRWEFIKARWISNDQSPGHPLPHILYRMPMKFIRISRYQVIIYFISLHVCTYVYL